jgi:iron complex outermembrane receptor protein
MLEEITVTAQKRSENQQKVAIAMDVITGEDLKTKGDNDIDDILGNLSSVMITSASDGLRVSIRGMSNDSEPQNNLNTSKPTVAVNRDGVYTNRNTSNTNLFDLERVEVLMGPQSTLYASASPGGVVNVMTADPKLDEYGGYGILEYGTYENIRMEGAMNAPIGEKMAVRGAFASSQHDGYLSNGEDDQNSNAGRMKFLAKPTDKLSMVVTGELSKSISKGNSGVVLFSDEDDVDDPWTAADSDAADSISNEEKRFTAKIDYDFGYAGTLSIVPAYTTADNESESTYTNFVRTVDGMTEADLKEYEYGTMEEKNLEIRMASSEDFPFKWVAGFNYYKSEETQNQEAYITEDDDGLPDDNHQYESDTETKAVYGNITYPVTETLRATGGIRMTWDEFSTGGYTWDVDHNPTNPYALEPMDQSSMDYSDPDYKLGVEYDLSESSMFYADYSTSYRLNGTSRDNILPPENLTAYTIGAKNRFFGNRLQVNVAAYYYDYENFFANGDSVRTIEDDNENGVWDEGENDNVDDMGQQTVGDAEIYGLDLSTTTVITANDKLDFSVSYISKTFKDITFDYEEITNSFGLDDLSYNDKEMTNAPEWTATIGYSHNFYLSSGASISAGIDYKFSSSYLLTWQELQPNLIEDQDEDGNTTGYHYEYESSSEYRKQDAYRIGNISVVYTSPDGKWSLSGYVKNIENTAVKRSLMGQNGDDLRLNSPRTSGLIFSVNF